MNQLYLGITGRLKSEGFRNAGVLIPAKGIARSPCNLFNLQGLYRRGAGGIRLRPVGCCSSFFKKGQKIGVELFLVRVGQAVRCAFIYL